MAKPQYAWKQNGTMERGWFPDKETCLNHCEEHKTDQPVYLYKRVVIPDGWTPFLMTSKYQSFHWIVKATKADQPDRTLLASLWSQTLRGCLCHFKKKLQEGFDVPDGWGTTYYLVMRRRLPPQEMTEKDSRTHGQ
jgi:hypothetical protein